MDFDVKNFFNERLDGVISGNLDSDCVVVFAHGFGTNRDEGCNLFLDLAKYLDLNFACVRFDFSGYGQSCGLDRDFNLHKASGDLECVLRFVSKSFSGKKIFLVAHSLGCYVSSFLGSDFVSKVVFTGIPNSDSNLIKDLFSGRILAKRGGVFDEFGISMYVRSSGGVQEIGCDFWKTLSFFDIDLFSNFVFGRSVRVFKPVSDEVVGNESFSAYVDVLGENYVELCGDHNFSDSFDREVLFSKILEFFQN